VKLTAQIYTNEGEARCFVKDGPTIDIRPPDGGEVTRVFIGNVLVDFGFVKNKRWKETSWGWQAEYISGRNLE